ncbi:MAG: TatD family hydrolase [Alphaproteobacteria bacterium]|nr:TatD family hydrolase [Alphaproteobacteria bacterium]
MFIDTHCHFTERHVSEDEISGILQRAKDAGVEKLIIVGADAGDAERIIALCDRYDNLYAALGIHPHSAGKAMPDYEHLLSHPRVIAVGETGLDYHYKNDNKDEQIALFRAQLDIARAHNLPVVVHSRDAEADTAEILSAPEYAGMPGVMHCYASSWDLADKMCGLGFYFSASGIITFKNAEEIRDVFRRLPADRILVETDAPYCAPVPHRGKTCEPAMVKDTAKVLAGVRGIPILEMEKILLENTLRLFPKML